MTMPKMAITIHQLDQGESTVASRSSDFGPHDDLRLPHRHNERLLGAAIRTGDEPA